MEKIYSRYKEQADRFKVNNNNKHAKYKCINIQCEGQGLLDWKAK